MKQPLRWRDLLTINAFWLGANIGSGILTPVLVPFLVASSCRLSRRTAPGAVR